MCVRQIVSDKWFHLTGRVSTPYRCDATLSVVIDIIISIIIIMTTIMITICVMIMIIIISSNILVNIPPAYRCDATRLTRLALRLERARDLLYSS